MVASWQKYTIIICQLQKHQNSTNVDIFKVSAECLNFPESTLTALPLSRKAISLRSPEKILSQFRLSFSLWSYASLASV